MPTRALIFVTVAALAVACASASIAKEAAAVIVKPNAASRADLQRAVSASLNRESVLLADDVLMRESVLWIEPARLRDSQGRPLQGRETRLPERFRLVKMGRICVLIHEGSGQRTTLNYTKCQALR